MLRKTLLLRTPGSAAGAVKRFSGSVQLRRTSTVAQPPAAAASAPSRTVPARLVLVWVVTETASTISASQPGRRSTGKGVAQTVSDRWIGGSGNGSSAVEPTEPTKPA